MMTYLYRSKARAYGRKMFCLFLGVVLILGMAGSTSSAEGTSSLSQPTNRLYMDRGNLLGKFIRIVTPKPNYEARNPKDYKVIEMGVYNHYSEHNPADKYFCFLPLCPTGPDLVDQRRFNVQDMLYQLYHQLDSGERDLIVRELSEATYFGYGAIPISKRTKYMQMALQMRIYEILGYRLEKVDGEDDFSWYRPLISEINRRRDNWRNESGLQGQTIELEPGASYSLIDEQGVLESFMWNAGYAPDTSYLLPETDNHVQFVWTWPNTITFSASKDFTGSAPVRFAAGGPSTQHCLDDGETQTRISTEYNMPPRTITFTLQAVRPENSLGQLKIEKTAPQIVAWTRQMHEAFGEELCQPLIEDLPLADVGFTLVSDEDIMLDGTLYGRTELQYSFRTNDLGIGLLEDIPCGRYILYEEDVSPMYEKLEGINITVEAICSDTDREPLRIHNKRREIVLTGVKVFKDVGDISIEAMEAIKDGVQFGLYTTETMYFGEETLPAGSLISLAQVSPLPNLNDFSESGEEHLELKFFLPFPGRFELREKLSSEYYQTLAPVELDLSGGLGEEGQVEGQLEFVLSEPLFNERKESLACCNIEERAAGEEEDLPEEKGTEPEERQENNMPESPDTSGKEINTEEPDKQVIEVAPQNRNELPVQVLVKSPNVDVRNINTLAENNKQADPPPKQVSLQEKAILLPSTGESRKAISLLAGSLLVFLGKWLRYRA